MAIIKTLDLIVQVKRLNPDTQEEETLQREFSVTKQNIINFLKNRYPALQTVDDIDVTAAGWSIQDVEV